MEYIYIAITQTGTTPAKFFRFFTRKPYNHVSLSSTADLSEMYSFCRTYRPIALPATFNKETVGKDTLGKFTIIPCEIYRIKVTEEQKNKYEYIIQHFLNKRRKYAYNILGLIPMWLHISWNRKSKFACSQFVAYTLNNIGFELQKSFSLYTPDDFRRFPGTELYYAGELNAYHRMINSRPDGTLPDVLNDPQENSEPQQFNIVHETYNNAKQYEI